MQRMLTLNLTVASGTCDFNDLSASPFSPERKTTAFHKTNSSANSFILAATCTDVVEETALAHLPRRPYCCWRCPRERGTNVSSYNSKRRWARSPVGGVDRRMTRQIPRTTRLRPYQETEMSSRAQLPKFETDKCRDTEKQKARRLHLFQDQLYTQVFRSVRHSLTAERIRVMLTTIRSRTSVMSPAV
jgi:hypothetical protein